MQLHHIQSIRRPLTTEVTRALVQDFVRCRLDYCNSLLSNVAAVHLRCLQGSNQYRMRQLIWSPALVSKLLPHHSGSCDTSSASSSPASYFQEDGWCCTDVPVGLHDEASRYLADLCTRAA